jgi:TPR repeat protein
MTQCSMTARKRTLLLALPIFALLAFLPVLDGRPKLGWMPAHFAYHLGQGVPKDDVEAYAWSNLAARAASSAAANCDDLEKRMSPQQVAAAKKRAKELQAMMDAKLKSNAK